MDFTLILRIDPDISTVKEISGPSERLYDEYDILDSTRSLPFLASANLYGSCQGRSRASNNAPWGYSNRKKA